MIINSLMSVIEFEDLIHEWLETHGAYFGVSQTVDGMVPQHWVISIRNTDSVPTVPNRYH